MAYLGLVVMYSQPRPVNGASMDIGYIANLGLVIHNQINNSETKRLKIPNLFVKMLDK